MFRRKDEEFESGDEAQQSLNVEAGAAASTSHATANKAPSSPSAPAASARPAAPQQQAAKPAPQPAAPAFRPASSSPAAPSRPAAAPAAANQQAAPAAQNARVLTVGNDILLKGEIATCDRLVIQGSVDAKLKDVHTVEIAETGSFTGGAKIEDAIISGLFEGDLVVRGRLVITSTGKVRGKISYGEIEIQRGGELSGEISMAGAEKSAAPKAKKAA